MSCCAVRSSRTCCAWPVTSTCTSSPTATIVKLERRMRHSAGESDEQLNARRRAAGAEGLARHCIYLGMAPGVGKTYAALHELRRRKTEGVDAVLAFVETYNRPRTIEAIGE